MSTLRFVVCFLLLGTPSYGEIITGVDLLSDSRSTFDNTRSTATSGSSLLFFGTPNAQGAGMMSFDTQTAINAGDTVSFTVDVRRVQLDTDFGFGVWDGSSFFGLLTYDIPLGAPDTASGSFTNLNSTANIAAGDSIFATGLVTPGNSGSLEFDITFGAAGTTLDFGGSYYTGLTGNVGAPIPGVYDFGSDARIVFLDGGDGSGSIYQINSLEFSTTSVPEPPALTGLLAIGLAIVIPAYRRRRQATN